MLHGVLGSVQTTFHRETQTISDIVDHTECPILRCFRDHGDIFRHCLDRWAKRMEASVDSRESRQTSKGNEIGGTPDKL